MRFKWANRISIFFTLMSRPLEAVFERVVEACIPSDLVGGEGFAVDASLIAADADKQRSIAGQDWRKDRNPKSESRALRGVSGDPRRHGMGSC